MTPTRHEHLAEALRRAVLAQAFEKTADRARGGAPVAHFPSIDLAMVVFGRGRTRLRPTWANVLFSREHPRGLVGAIGERGGALRHLRFDADVVDADGRSYAWAPEADWQRIVFPPLSGSGPHRFVVPYPASLLKLMVAVGVGLAVDLGRAAWPAADVGPMITVSDNDATDRCVALLHRARVLDLLHERFAALGLPTLRLNRTTPAGGWRNGDGSGVGHIHMTAWDTVRLLWLLDADALPPPWLPGTSDTTGLLPLLQPATRERLRALLEAQERNDILSSHSLRAVPGFVEGLPPSVRFAHKTGTTENYASDAGIVVAKSAPPALHAIVAVITNLGERYAPHERCSTTWRLPALGSALHRIALEWT
ncbi:MAG: serine hydrolase [Burkholderiales bacterium]|nr:serine hydrolase [Burkholderiales bacterium]